MKDLGWPESQTYYIRRPVISTPVFLPKSDIGNRMITMTASGLFAETQSTVDPKEFDNNKRGAHRFQGNTIPKNRFNQPKKHR